MADASRSTMCHNGSGERGTLDDHPGFARPYVRGACGCRLRLDACLVHAHEPHARVHLLDGGHRRARQPPHVLPGGHPAARARVHRVPARPQARRQRAALRAAAAVRVRHRVLRARVPSDVLRLRGAGRERFVHGGHRLLLVSGALHPAARPHAGIRVRGVVRRGRHHHQAAHRPRVQLAHQPRVAGARGHHAAGRLGACV